MAALFLVDMRLAGTARTQLAEVEVVLYKRNHARQQQPFLALRERIRLIAARAQLTPQPLVLGELPPSLFQLVDIHMGHLDGRQPTDMDRGGVLVLLDKFVLQSHDAPDAAASDGRTSPDIPRKSARS